MGLCQLSVLRVHSHSVCTGLVISYKLVVLRVRKGLVISYELVALRVRKRLLSRLVIRVRKAGPDYKAKETVVDTHLHTDAVTLLVSIVKTDKYKYEVCEQKSMI